MYDKRCVMRRVIGRVIEWVIGGMIWRVIGDVIECVCARQHV